MRAASVALLAAVVVVGLATGAGATSFRIDAVDAQSQYTGFTPVVSDSGVFTFNDTLNGTNTSPEPGTVTASEVPGLPTSSLVDLEIVLDTSAFDPSTGFLAPGVRFEGTGPGSEILIWDSTHTSVLLSFDIEFINVTTVAPFGDGSFTLGAPSLAELNASSKLTVSGGSLAASVGGIGTPAVLEIIVDSPSPQITPFNLSGYLNDDFTVGIPDYPPVGQVDIALTIPEPGAAGLVVLALAALGAGRRRRP